MAYNASIRSPSWSPDGSQVFYEKIDFNVICPMSKELYSWDDEWDDRFTDILPQLSLQGKLAITQKQLGNSSTVAMSPDGCNLKGVFDVFPANMSEAAVAYGLSGVFQPSCASSGDWLVFGVGSWFQNRSTGSGALYCATANGSFSEQLTDGSVNTGFPSYSPGGRYIVYRVFGGEYGLCIMDLEGRSVRILTNATTDNYGNLSF
jgi:Tol biopolymer transport system component